MGSGTDIFSITTASLYLQHQDLFSFPLLDCCMWTVVCQVHVLVYGIGGSDEFKLATYLHGSSITIFVMQFPVIA